MAVLPELAASDAPWQKFRLSMYHRPQRCSEVGDLGEADCRQLRLGASDSERSAEQCLRDDQKKRFVALRPSVPVRRACSGRWRLPS